MANLSSSHCFVPLQLGQEANLGCSSCPPPPTAHMAERSCSRTGHPSPVTSRSPCDRPGKQGFLGRLPWEHTVFPRGSWRAGEGSASADLPTIKADKFVPPNRLFLAAPVSAFTQSNLKSLSLSETLLPSSLGSQQEPPHLSQGLRAPSAPHPGAADLSPHTLSASQKIPVPSDLFPLISCPSN